MLGPMAAFYEYSNELSEFYERRQLLMQLKNYQLLYHVHSSRYGVR
jgi:hypothetical protein